MGAAAAAHVCHLCKDGGGQSASGRLHVWMPCVLCFLNKPAAARHRDSYLAYLLLTSPQYFKSKNIIKQFDRVWQLYSDQTSLRL